MYGPTGALAAAVLTGGAASARHRTTETEPRGFPRSQLPPQPTHTGGRIGRASELCIVPGGESGRRIADCAVSWCGAAAAMGSKRGARF